MEPGPLDGRSTAADGGEVLPEVNGLAEGAGDGAGGRGGSHGGGGFPPKPRICRARISCKRSNFSLTPCLASCVTGRPLRHCGRHSSCI